MKNEKKIKKRDFLKSKSIKIEDLKNLKTFKSLKPSKIKFKVSMV